MRRLASLLFIVCACSRSEPPAAFRLRIAAVGPLEPLSANIEHGYSALIQSLVFEPLLHPASDGRRTSNVVDGWDRIGRGQYRFRLKPGVTFSDGSALEARDIAAALGKEAVVGVEDGALTATWRTPEEGLEVQLLSLAIRRGPLGTGPFVVAAQDAEHILLQRRTRMPGGVDEVELVSFASPREAFAAALRRDVNVLLMPDDGQLELLAGVDQLRLIRGPGIHSVAALLNPKRPADERKQLVVALRDARVAGAYGALCEPLTREPGIALPAGAPMDVVVMSAPPGLGRTGLAIRRALGARGGEIHFVTADQGQRRAETGDFGVLVTAVQTWPAEFAAGQWLTGSAANVTGYSNPSVDSALRAADFVAAQAALAEDPPMAVLCRLERTAAVDARLTDANLGAYDLLESLPDWRLAR